MITVTTKGTTLGNTALLFFRRPATLAAKSEDPLWEITLVPGLTLCDPHALQPPGYSVHRIFRQGIGVGCHFLLLGISPDPGETVRSL